MPCACEFTFDVKALRHTIQEDGEGETHHVYVGSIDGVTTKWVTRRQWNGALRWLPDGRYVDAHGDGVIVCEDDEDEFAKW